MTKLAVAPKRRDTPASNVSLDGLTNKELAIFVANRAIETDGRIEQVHDMLTTQTAAIKNLAETLVASRAETKALSESVGSLKSEVSRVADRPDHTIAIGHLAELVGKPPATIDPRSSSVDELTQEQLGDLETKGTGLFRLVGQLARSDRTIVSAIAKDAGRAAGTRSALITALISTSPSWGPWVVDAVSRAF